MLISNNWVVPISKKEKSAYPVKVPVLSPDTSTVPVPNSKELPFPPDSLPLPLSLSLEQAPIANENKTTNKRCDVLLKTMFKID